MTVTFTVSADLNDQIAQRVIGFVRSEDLSSACELGGGAKPLLSPGQIHDLGVRYTILDIAPEELAKAADDYEKIVGDAASPSLEVAEEFDLVLSRMVAEHIPDPQQFHRNCFRLLAPGGYAVHIFPTLFYPWFVINRLVPERLTQRVLTTVQPHRTQDGKYRKFPAYYRWCRGPTASQITRLEAIGFEIVEYQGLFGTSYLRRFGPLLRAEQRVAQYLVEHPRPELTAYGLMVLRKPV